MSKIGTNGYILIGIFLIAVFLRLLGANPGFPLSHADEQSTFGHIYNIIIKHTLHPGDFYYGPLLGYIYAFFDVTFFIPALFQIFTIQNLYNYIFVQQRPIFEFYNFFVDTQLKTSWPLFDFSHNYLTYWGRYSTAILSSVTVIAIYFLGKSLFGNKSIGLIAAFLTAVNYRHVFSSTLLLADAPAALFASISLLLSVSILKNKTMSSYLLAGVGLALAYSVKYFIYVLPAFIICHFFSVWQSPKTTRLKKIQNLIINKKFILAFIVSAILFLLLHPYLIIKYGLALEQFKNNASNYKLYSSSLDLSATNYSLYPIYYLWKYGLGMMLSLVTIGGIFYGLIRYTKQSIILLSVIVPFFYVFVGMAGRVGTVHNFSSIIPIMLLFPALIIYKLGTLAPINKHSSFIIVILTLLIGFPSFKNSLISSFYFSKPPNVYVFANWQEKNIPKESSAMLIDPVREEYMTIQDLKTGKINWAIIDSGWNIVLNDKWTKNNIVIRNTFFNEDLFWEVLNNTYLSLVTKELGDYRIKEITKPFWQPMDSAFFVIKVPKFWDIHKDILIKKYTFSKENELKEWTITSSLSQTPNIYLSKNLKNNSSGIKIAGRECALQTRISSGRINVSENKWHTVSSLAKRKNLPTRNTRDGFLRLDFYSAEDRIIKTYVSKHVNNTAWEIINSSGISPLGSKYAKITFQIDNCFIKEEYYLDKVEFFTSDASTKIDKKEYPYYGQDLPKNFIWAPTRYL